MSDTYDLLVVGAGPAGSAAAITAAQAGQSVLMIDKIGMDRAADNRQRPHPPLLFGTD